MVITVKQHI